MCAFVVLGFVFPYQTNRLGNVSEMTYFVSSGAENFNPVTRCEQQKPRFSLTSGYLKIGQHLMKLQARVVWWHCFNSRWTLAQFFMPHVVYSTIVFSIADICLFRDRVIHLLAVRAYKEPELILRLQRGAVFHFVFCPLFSWFNCKWWLSWLFAQHLVCAICC